MEGGSVTIAMAAKHSAPDGLRLETTLSPSFSSATLQFDMQVESADPIAQPVFASLDFDDGTAVHSVEYTYRAPPNTGEIEDVVVIGTNAPSYTYYVFATPPPGAWHRIVMQVTTFDNVVLTAR